MTIKVKLENIIEGMEFQTDESSSYLDRKTGKVIHVGEEEFRDVENDEPLDDFPGWQHESIMAARKISESPDDYILLPIKFDIHEYSIMERFCRSIKDDELRNEMCFRIQGRGAFRMFKDGIHRYNIEQDWYRFRDEAFREIAVSWCEENGLEYG